MPGFFTLFDGKMRAPGEGLLSVVVPLMKLLCLPVIGLILAHPKTQIALRATFKLLSKLVFALFLPCLIFTHLGQSITLKNVALWWFIPVNVVVSTVIGCILGYVVAIICCPPPEFIRFTIIMTAFGNTGYLSIGIVGSVCHSLNHSFGPDCHRTSVACVPLAQWVAVILVYTLVYYMMEPPLEYYEIVEEEIEIVEREQVNEVSRPLLVEAEWPGIEDKETEHSKTPFIAGVFKSISGLSHTAFPELDLTEEGSCSSPKSIRCLACPQE